MQGKVEILDVLSEELELETVKNLSNRDLVNFAQTSTYRLGLFKPVIDILKLLHYVARGNHEAVKSLLEDEPRLIWQRGTVTDCSGREFKNVSGFEYALWALDKHMWTTMIACIPNNEEGRKIFNNLMAQYNKVNTDGVTYRLNGKIITEKHFNFENTIIKELQTYVDSTHAPGDRYINGIPMYISIKPSEDNWEAINKQWREGVGGAQKLLPMHIVDEYCSDEQFHPVPKFTSRPKSSKQLFNWTTKESENWFHVDSKLGFDFAIAKTEKGAQVAQGREFWLGLYAWVDLVAITALCKVRAQDFINLKSQLERQAGLDNHHQIVPR